MILLRNGALFDGVIGELRAPVDVMIEGTRIKEISEKPLAPGDAQVIDLAGRTIMPGLIDAHVHVIAADANLSKLDEMPRAILYYSAKRTLERGLQRGFTSVRDAGGADYGIAQAIDTNMIKGPRLFFSGKALSQTGGHGDFRGYETSICQCGQGGATMSVIADGVPAVRTAAREELRRGATQIKIMASGGVASPSDPIGNLQYSDEEIRAAVWEAKSWNTYVMAHAYTPEAIRRAVHFGVRSIEHGNLIDYETAALVAMRGAFVVPTLVTYESLAEFGRTQGFPDVSLQKLEHVREAGLKALEILRRAGVKIGLGTDLLGEMRANQSRELSIRAEIQTPAQVLISATSTNADLLNRAGELGVIQADALADILVVDGNPLKEIHLLEGQGEHLALIMKDGVIHKNRLV